eukprot:gene662-821_t
MIVFVNAESKPVKIHLVCHSHDDSGWIRTFEEYYYESVFDILTSTVESLIENPKRKFVWSEIGFLERWWNDERNNLTSAFKKLVDEKRIEFVNGGWVQNDEACPSLEQVIRQLTLGHKFIWDHFGVRPETGWQIDPFGHSSLTPTIQAQMGYKHLILNRIHFQTKEQLKNSRNLQFLWRGSPNGVGEHSDILAHILDDHYTSPDKFDFDSYRNPYFSNDMLAQEMTYVGIQRAQRFVSPHVLIPIGGDFNFRRAQNWFKPLDSIIEIINNKTSMNNVTIQYSTLNDFFTETKDWMKQNDIAFNYYDGDFFPYADSEYAYWTGYFTSRPVLKGYSRATTSLLRHTEIFSSLQSRPHHFEIDNAARNCSILMHHDAITGTSRQEVVDDYSFRLDHAESLLHRVTASSVGQLMDSSNPAQLNPIFENHLVNFILGDIVPIVLTNSLGWERSQVYTIRIEYYEPTPESCPYSVYSNNKEIECDCSLRFESQEEILYAHSMKFIQISFLATVPALGAKVFYVSSKPGGKTYWVKKEKTTIRMENKFMDVKIDTNTSLLREANYRNGGSVILNQELLDYKSVIGGAYIFSPSGGASTLWDKIKVSTSFWPGKLILEHRTTYNYNLNSYSSDDYKYPSTVSFSITNTGINELDEKFNFEYSIPGKPGFESIVKFTTSLNNSYFHSDNGLELIQRRRIDKPYSPQYNYFPSISISMITDDFTNQSFICHSDRTKGVTSIREGELEVMIHRNLLSDDNKGLGIPPRDFSNVQTKHQCYHGPQDKIRENARKQSLLHDNPLRGYTFLYYGQNQFTDLSFQMMEQPSLPESVHILSLERNKSSSCYTLRIMNIRETGKKESVDISKLFKSIKPTGALELNNLSGINNTNIDLTNEISVEYNPIFLIDNHFPVKNGPQFDKQINGHVITLAPLEIKTLNFYFISTYLDEDFYQFQQTPTKKQNFYDTNCPDTSENFLKWSELKLPPTLEEINITGPILLDISPYPLKLIKIFGKGKLVWKHIPGIELKVGAILVYGGGAFIIGSEDCKFKYKATITLTGDSIYTETNHTISQHNFGQKVIGVGMDGTLEIHGDTPKVVWTKLNQTFYSNYFTKNTNNILTLMDDVSDWKLGSEVVIGSTDYDEYQSEVGTIVDCPTCKKNQIRLKETPKYLHWGTISEGIDERGEIGILTRNILIQGHLGSNCTFRSPIVCRFFPKDTFGGHIMVMKQFKNVHIEGAELFQMGQPHMLSRYPIHFHMAGFVNKVGGYDNPAYIRKCTVHKSFSRCYVVHGTHGLEISDNIGFDSIGHCFMMCDGIETGNIFNHNLGLLTKPGLLLPSDRNCDMCLAVTPVDFNGNPTSCSECNAISTFWITNPNNTYTNNVAGGSAINGFWVVIPDYPVGDSAMDGRLLNIRPVYTPIFLFENNTVHSNLDGITIDQGLKTTLPSESEPQQYQSMVGQRYKPRSNPKDPNSEPRPSIFTGLVSYKNRWRGGWARGGYLIFNRCSFGDNAIGFTIGSEGTHPADPYVGQEMNHCLFVGESENIGQPSSWIPVNRGRTNPFGEGGNMPIRGFEVYDGSVFLNDITFNSFLKDNTTRNISAIGFYRLNDWQESCKSYLNRIKFNKVSLPFHFENSMVDGDKISTILDLDGTATKSKNSSFVLVRNFQYYKTENCKTMETWDGLICNETSRQLFVFNPLPENTNYNNVAPGLIVIRDSDMENVIQLTGIPNYIPRRHFLTLVFKSSSYSFHFPHPTPPNLYFEADNWEKGEEMKFAICTIAKKSLSISVFKRIGNWRKYQLDQVHSLDDVDSKHFYHDRHTGLVHVILHQENNRTGMGYCPQEGCESIEILLNGPYVGRVTGDCQTAAYGMTMSIFDEQLNKKFKSPSLLNGDVTVIYNDPDHSYRGQRYLSFLPTNSSSIKFECNGCIPSTGIKYLEMWSNGGDYKNQLLYISLISSNSTILKPITLDQNQFLVNTWSLIRMKFTDLLPLNSGSNDVKPPYNGLIIYGGYLGTQNLIFLDDIKLVYDS